MDKVRIKQEELVGFCKEVFKKLGCNEDEALNTAEILVAADARGIESHGVGRLKRYVDGIKTKVMFVNQKPEILRETPMSIVLDANGAMGMNFSKNTMDHVIDMAKKNKVGFASTRNSNHFGIAGYYSEMAAKQNFIGITMTNTAALGVPTFSKKSMFGTNPIAISVPASKGRIFTLDMATTCVTRGKLEVYNRNGSQLPIGWVVDTKGKDSTKVTQVLEDMLYQRGGGMLPLGGSSKLMGGHKGYGLAEVVDIFTALLSAGDFGQHVFDSAQTSARVCHYFSAISIDLFRDIDEFKESMGGFLDELNNSPVADDCERVYYAGQRSHESEQESKEKGVPVAKNVIEILKKMGLEYNVEFPKYTD